MTAEFPAHLRELNPRLHEHVVKGPLGWSVDHPLLGVPLVREAGVPVVNAHFQRKCEEAGYAFRRGDWKTWVLLHREGHRLEALRSAVKGPLSSEVSLLRECLIHSDNRSSEPIQSG